MKVFLTLCCTLAACTVLDAPDPAPALAALVLMAVTCAGIVRVVRALGDGR